jgi:ribose transport system permease protein
MMSHSTDSATPGRLLSAIRRLRGVEVLGVLVALVAMCVALGLTTSSFLQQGNLLQVARQSSGYGIMAVGMVFLLAMGDIDLSVGSTLTLVNIVTAIAMRDGAPVWLAVLIGLATGVVCGTLNGLLCVLLRVPSIMVTLGTMSLFRGFALVLSKATPISGFPKTSGLFTIGGETIAGIPSAVIVMLLVAATGFVLLNRTPFGWRVQAIGSNPQAARFSGIPIARYRIAVMALMGLISAIAGIVALAFLQSADPNTGLGAELFVIASALIGGTALTGGSGSVVGAVLGALTIAVIRNGLVLLDVKAYWDTAATGAVIIAAVAVGALIKRR